MALTRYADACPPTLHPDCPFAVERNGAPTCDRECRDEITRLQRPGHDRVRVFSDRLFDARQLLLSESGRIPGEAWHTASLIVRLGELLRRPPVFLDGRYALVREIAITNALAYLGHRGLDSDWLVRFGFGSDLPARIALWVGDNHLRGATPVDDVTGGWLSIAESFMGQNRKFEDLGPWFAEAQSSGLVQHIEKWIQQASLEAIWSWTPSDVDPATVTVGDGAAQWIVDRFRETYLSDWQEESLHLEYRYLSGDISSPMPVIEMKRREVRAVDLNAALAERTVLGRGRQHSADVRSQALRFLDEGRRREAAALFDAARIINPDDADAHNHYGFCITPDEPPMALAAIQYAAGFDAVDPVNTINEAVVLELLGRPAEALAAAEQAFERFVAGKSSAYLWRRPVMASSAQLILTDALAYVIELGQELTEVLGDQSAQAVWSQRLEDLSSEVE